MDPSNVKQTIEHEYESIRGVPLISDKTDWIALANLRKKINGKLDINAIITAWRRYLASDRPFHAQQGHPLRWFCNNVNGFLVETRTTYNPGLDYLNGLTNDKPTMH